MSVTMAGPVVIAADSPGMPDIGPDFIVEARRLAGTDEHDHEGDAAEIVAAIGSAIPEGPQLAKAMGPEWAALAKSKDPGDLAKAAGGLAEYYENASNRPDLAGWIVRFGVDWAKQCRSKSPNVLGAATRKVAAFLKEQRSGEEYAKLAGYATQLYQAALYEPGFQLMVRVGEKQLPATFVPGHLIGPPPEDGNPQPPIDPGPVPADVLVISKHPGAEEVARKRNFVGKSAEPWYRAADELGVRELISDWYVTNLVRHPQLDPSADRLAKSWITNCMPLLQTELRVVRPKFILGLGSDAAKALLGESVNVTKARNRVFNIEIPAHGGEPASVARMMVILHPGVVAHDPAQYEDFREGLAGFLKLLDGEEPQVCRTPVRQHTNIFKERHLKEVVDEIVARPDGNIIAIDCEWGAELRTIQFSARAGEGYSVVLRTEHDRPVFTPSVDAARGHLTRLFKSTPERRVRIGGHYFKADFPWLRDYGIDLSDEFDVADTPEETRTRGGFDTAYMLNSVFETGAPYELETWAVKLLGVPRYDEPINKWISSWRKANKETRASMKGYSMVPDDYLIGNPLKALPNYAAFDPDATRELFDVLNGVGDRPGLLDRDQYGLDSRRAYWISHAALPAFIEMEQTGMLVDRERLDRLASEFMDSRSRELTVLRDMIRWPDFNIGSDQQVRELLFGEEYNRKLDTKTQQARRLRPPGAVCLRLEPVKSTGKRGKVWERVVLRADSEMFRPAGDHETLGILAHAEISDRPVLDDDDRPVMYRRKKEGVYEFEDVELRVTDVLKQMLDVRALDKALSYPLGEPEADADGKYVTDASGRFSYGEKGISRFIGRGGRVRSMFFPRETGRCASAKPNMQAVSSKLRSIFRASPGHAIVKTDLKSAELWVVAQFAQDRQLIREVEGAFLPEDHPDFIDMHCLKAVNAFKLSCKPTKKAFKEAGVIALRKGAKNQTYGGLYGRGVPALVRQCLAEGTIITEAEMAELVRADAESHPDLIRYLEGAALRAYEPGYITNPFGRHRRIAWSPDEFVMASAGRQLRNYPIQSTVADVVMLAMRNFHQFRKSYVGPHTFKCLLPVHDELDFEVPFASIPWFIDDVIPRCIESIEIPVTDYDGVPISGTKPFRMSTDTSVYIHWGEKITPEQGEELGIPLKYLTYDD